MSKGTGTTRSGSAANPTGVGTQATNVGTTISGVPVNSGTLAQAKNTGFTKVDWQHWTIDTPHGGGDIFSNEDAMGETIYEATAYTYNMNGSANIMKAEEFYSLNDAKEYIKGKFI